MKFSVSLQFLYEDYIIIIMKLLSVSGCIIMKLSVHGPAWAIITFRLYRTAQVYKQSGKILSLKD